MLSVKVLVGLMSVIAHHFTVIIRRSPRLDCSLALGPGTADMVEAWSHPCSRASQIPLFLPPLLGLATGATSGLSLSCFWGFTVKGCQNPWNNKREKGGEVLAQPSFIIPPLLYWHSGRVASGQKQGSTERERCSSPQGGKGTHQELVSSRLH